MIYTCIWSQWEMLSVTCFIFYNCKTSFIFSLYSETPSRSCPQPSASAASLSAPSQAAPNLKYSRSLRRQSKAAVRNMNTAVNADNSCCIKTLHLWSSLKVIYMFQLISKHNKWPITKLNTQFIRRLFGKFWMGLIVSLPLHCKDVH